MLREHRRDDVERMIKALYDHFHLGGSRTEPREGDEGSRAGGAGSGGQNDGGSGTGSATPGRRTPYSERMSILIPALVAMLGALAILLTYAYYDTPAEADPWIAVMAAYPNGGVQCHAAVVDSILHMADVLYDGPYAIDPATGRPSVERAQQIAIDIVIGATGGRTVPAECGAGE